MPECSSRSARQWSMPKRREESEKYTVPSAATAAFVAELHRRPGDPVQQHLDPAPFGVDREQAAPRVADQQPAVAEQLDAERPPAGVGDHANRPALRVDPQQPAVLHSRDHPAGAVHHDVLRPCAVQLDQPHRWQRQRPAALLRPGGGGRRLPHDGMERRTAHDGSSTETLGGPPPLDAPASLVAPSSLLSPAGARRWPTSLKIRDARAPVPHPIRNATPAGVALRGTRDGRYRIPRSAKAWVTTAAAPAP